MDMLQNMAIDAFLSSPVGEKLAQTMKAIEKVQKNLFALQNSDDSAQLNLLKIGTVFQIFLIDTLAAGKRPESLSKEDWARIAERVSYYAVLEDGQSYSEFVFTLYADYIELSVEVLKNAQKELPADRLGQMEVLSKEIRKRGERLHQGEIDEVTYVDDCLWIALEAMVKLLSIWLTSRLMPLIGADYAQLATAVTDLAFEYGRYVLFAKEQALLEAYIDHQYLLDEKLQLQYEAYLSELWENAERFQGLLDHAFSADIRESLMHSAVLARASGVAENEILVSVDDVDAFFMD